MADPVIDRESGPATDPAVLEPLVSLALELRDDGAPDWLHRACAARPDLADEVRAVVDSAVRLESTLDVWRGQDARIGAVLGGRYQIEQRLGSGAMGVVYRARDLELGRLVAIKVVRFGFGDPEALAARFQREAEAMASTHHRAVVTIYDRGRLDDGEAFIVMELLEGVSLADVLDEARRMGGGTRRDDTEWLTDAYRLELPAGASYLRTVVGWAADLASGLEALHRSGVLHRDVKPSNVFVRRSGEPVLLDFGIAALEGNATLTREGDSVGTPAYMAPEALSARTPPRPALDVYGLTATLYHLLTHRMPYEGSVSQVLAAIASGDPAPAERLRPGLPRDLQAILDQGMHRNPKQRYASAAALESDLRAFLEYRPVVARPIGRVRRLWRRIARSKAARGAFVVVALVAMRAAFVQWQGHVEERRLARYTPAMRQLPPNFTVVRPEARVLRSEADRRDLAALLDVAVANAPSPLPSALLRSSFRLDHGDPGGAAEDMRAIASELGTGYADALAARYAKPIAGVVGAGAIDLASLPEPRTGEDRYLAGYHLMRAGDHEGARALFGEPDVRVIPHAEELWILSTGFGGLSSTEARELASERLMDALRLEASPTGRTAGTAHAVGRMLLALGRYQDARRAIADGLALAGRAHPLRINAGLAAWRLGLEQEAREHWRVALELAPEDHKIHQNLVWLALDAGNYAEAERVLAAAPFGDDDRGRAARLVVEAGIATDRALHARALGDDAEVEAQATRALECLSEASALGPLPRNEYGTISSALLADDPAVMFSSLARSLAADPERWQRLARLVEQMPRELDAEATESLRCYLSALEQQLINRVMQPPLEGTSETNPEEPVAATPSAPESVPAAVAPPGPAPVGPPR